MIHFHVITLFPESVDSYVHESILGRAIKEKKIKVSLYNPRDFIKDKRKKNAGKTEGKSRRVDSRPYGGGPGMVIEAEPVLKAIQKAIGKKENVKILFFSPSGKEFNEPYAKKLATKCKDVVLISGHYEGIDARVVKILKAESISTGPYVLTGGEVPAMAVIDAVSRFIGGVLGNEASLEESRASSPEVYTRPEVLKWKKKNHKVPQVLLSGHHKDIDEWKNQKRSKKA